MLAGAFAGVDCAAGAFFPSVVAAGVSFASVVAAGASFASVARCRRIRPICGGSGRGLRSVGRRRRASRRCRISGRSSCGRRGLARGRSSPEPVAGSSAAPGASTVAIASSAGRKILVEEGPETRIRTPPLREASRDSPTGGQLRLSRCLDHGTPPLVSRSPSLHSSTRQRRVAK